MEKIEIMQGLSVGVVMAVILLTFYLLQYFYTGFKKVKTTTTNQNIAVVLKHDKNLTKLLLRIEMSIYLFLSSLTTAYVVTIIM